MLSDEEEVESGLTLSTLIFVCFLFFRLLTSNFGSGTSQRFSFSHLLLFTKRMFSGFKSVCTKPELCRKCTAWINWRNDGNGMGRWKSNILYKTANLIGNFPDLVHTKRMVLVRLLNLELSYNILEKGEVCYSTKKSRMLKPYCSKRRQV